LMKAGAPTFEGATGGEHEGTRARGGHADAITRVASFEALRSWKNEFKA